MPTAEQRTRQRGRTFCQDCNKSFHAMSYKRHHKTQHEGEKRKDKACYFCNWAGSESSLSSHLTFHHMPKEGRDPCQHCNFNWTWEGNPSAPKLIDHTELCPCADETGTWEWDRDYELFVRKGVERRKYLWAIERAGRLSRNLSLRSVIAEDSRSAPGELPPAPALSTTPSHHYSYNDYNPLSFGAPSYQPAQQQSLLSDQGFHSAVLSRPHNHPPPSSASSSQFQQYGSMQRGGPGVSYGNVPPFNSQLVPQDFRTHAYDRRLPTPRPANAVPIAGGLSHFTFDPLLPNPTRAGPPQPDHPNLYPHYSNFGTYPRSSYSLEKPVLSRRRAQLYFDI